MSERWQFYHIDSYGASYLLNDGVTVLWDGADGLGLEGADPFGTRVPYQLGQEAEGLYLPSRSVALAFLLCASTPAALTTLDSELLRKVQPFKRLERGDLSTLRIVTDDGRTRDLDGWVVAYPKPSDDRVGRILARRVIEYWSPSPLFYDPTEQSESLAISGDGGTTFPITFPITFASTTIADRVYPNNVGDVETWPTIRVNGPGINPTVKNETVDKTMALTKTLDSGDYIDIDMAAATITMYDASAGTSESIIEDISAASEFWPLAVGSNTVYATMAGAVSGSIVLTYTLKYVEV